MNEIMLQDKPYEYYDHIKNKNMKIGTAYHQTIDSLIGDDKDYVKWLIENKQLIPHPSIVHDVKKVKINYTGLFHQIIKERETFNPNTGEWELKPKYIWI